MSDERIEQKSVSKTKLMEPFSELVWQVLSLKSDFYREFFDKCSGQDEKDLWVSVVLLANKDLFGLKYEEIGDRLVDNILRFINEGGFYTGEESDPLKDFVDYATKKQAKQKENNDRSETSLVSFKKSLDWGSQVNIQFLSQFFTICRKIPINFLSNERIPALNLLLAVSDHLLKHSSSSSNSQDTLAFTHMVSAMSVDYNFSYLPDSNKTINQFLGFLEKVSEVAPEEIPKFFKKKDNDREPLESKIIKTPSCVMPFLNLVEALHKKNVDKAAILDCIEYGCTPIMRSNDLEWKNKLVDLLFNLMGQKPEEAFLNKIISMISYPKLVQSRLCPNLFIEIARQSDENLKIRFLNNLSSIAAPRDFTFAIVPPMSLAKINFHAEESSSADFQESMLDALIKTQSWKTLWFLFEKGFIAGHFLVEDEVLGVSRLVLRNHEDEKKRHKIETTKDSVFSYDGYAWLNRFYKKELKRAIVHINAELKKLGRDEETIKQYEALKEKLEECMCSDSKKKRESDPGAPILLETKAYPKTSSDFSSSLRDFLESKTKYSEDQIETLSSAVYSIMSQESPLPKLNLIKLLDEWADNKEVKDKITRVILQPSQHYPNVCCAVADQGDVAVKKKFLDLLSHIRHPSVWTPHILPPFKLEGRFDEKSIYSSIRFYPAERAMFRILANRGEGEVLCKLISMGFLSGGFPTDEDGYYRLSRKAEGLALDHRCHRRIPDGYTWRSSSHLEAINKGKKAIKEFLTKTSNIKQKCEFLTSISTPGTPLRKFIEIDRDGLGKTPQTLKDLLDCYKDNKDIFDAMNRSSRSSGSHMTSNSSTTLSASSLSTGSTVSSSSSSASHRSPSSTSFISTSLPARPTPLTSDSAMSTSASDSTLFRLLFSEDKEKKGPKNKQDMGELATQQGIELLNLTDTTPESSVISVSSNPSGFLSQSKVPVPVDPKAGGVVKNLPMDEDIELQTLTASRTEPT